MNREHIAAEIKDRFLAFYEGDHAQNACLYWSQAAVDVLTDLGHRAIIQAGSCSWPRVFPHQDDGVSATHMSYVWDPGSDLTREMLAQGKMPEMHVWVALPERGEIIDMTTGFWPANCLAILGMDWPGPKPPEYFWGTEEDLPNGVVYDPDVQAIGWALWALREDDAVVVVRKAGDPRAQELRDLLREFDEKIMK